jgi:hypothetical protein
MYKRDNDDRVYYNVTMPYKPDVNGLSPAVFQQELYEPLIHKPDDWYLSIIRFTIPTLDIPIFIPEIQPFPNVNLLNTAYSVELTYNGNSSGQTFVQYISSQPNAQQSEPLTATHPFADKTLFYYIYGYIDFINMVNTALATAFAALPGKPVGSEAPFFIYDAVTQRISLIAQTLYYDLALALPIEIFVNYKLLLFMDAIPAIFYSNNSLSGRDAQFNMINFFNNYLPVDTVITPSSPYLYGDYFQLIQEYDILASWNSFKSLELISNLLPIKQEFVAHKGVNQSTVVSQGILKDFEPILDRGPEARTTVQYQLQSPYQIINLYGTTPLSKIDISLYWTDQLKNQYQLYIPYNQVATIKMVFIKKNTFTG